MKAKNNCLRNQTKHHQNNNRGLNPMIHVVPLDFSQAKDTNPESSHRLRHRQQQDLSKINNGLAIGLRDRLSCVQKELAKPAGPIVLLVQRSASPSGYFVSITKPVVPDHVSYETNLDQMDSCVPKETMFSLQMHVWNCMTDSKKTSIN